MCVCRKLAKLKSYTIKKGKLSHMNAGNKSYTLDIFYHIRFNTVFGES